MLKCLFLFKASNKTVPRFYNMEVVNELIYIMHLETWLWLPNTNKDNKIQLMLVGFRKPGKFCGLKNIYIQEAILNVFRLCRELCVSRKTGKWLKPFSQPESVRFILMTPTHSDENQLTTLYLPRKRPWSCFPAKTAKECLCMLGVLTRNSSIYNVGVAIWVNELDKPFFSQVLSNTLIIPWRFCIRHMCCIWNCIRLILWLFIMY